MVNRVRDCRLVDESASLVSWRAVEIFRPLGVVFLVAGGKQQRREKEDGIKRERERTEMGCKW